MDYADFIDSKTQHGADTGFALWDVVRAIGIALDALGEVATDPAVVALVGVVRALCGIGVRG